MRKLSNEDIDYKLIDRNIKRLDNYIGIHCKIQWKCLKCKYIWEAVPASILNYKSGCPKCSNNLKLNNNIIDNKIINRKIKRLDNNLGAKIKINWQCLTCDYTWKSTPDNIINNNRGCPQCGGTIKLNNNIIDQRVLGRDLIRVGNYESSFIKIEWKCLLCNNIWLAAPNNIVNGKKNCPLCFGTNKLTNDVIDKRILPLNIKRNSEYINNHTQMHFQCLKENCNFLWETNVSSLIYSKSGCPKCANVAKHTNASIDSLLIDRKIKRLSNYVNNYTKLQWLCLNEGCSYTWEAAPTSIITIKSGCPICSSLKNEKIIYSTLLKNQILFDYHKPIKSLNIDSKYIVDFYIPKINTIIEYNGRQHYQLVRFGGISKERAAINLEKQIIRDNNLINICKNNNINLICIDGRKYQGSKLEKLLNEEIIQIIKKESHVK